MSLLREQRPARCRETIALLFLVAAPFFSANSATDTPSKCIIAEGEYVTGDSENPMRDHWVLSKTAKGRYIAEGNAVMNQPQTEILNYRIEMDSSLHPSLIELHTIMDYPSYDCRLTHQTVKCAIWFSGESDSKGKQEAHMQVPFDLMGLHSFGWNFSSILGRLRTGQAQTTVHLFLPNEDRYPHAVAEVYRESPEPITVAGKTLEAQRFRLKLIMDESDVSEATFWTSRSGLVLKALAIGKAPGGAVPGVELTSYKQSEVFAPEFQTTDKGSKKCGQQD